ncbi:MAG: tRNA 2-thiocytidine(32) synthetase TtcA, partial [Erysipelotrichaceae bacterium]|nr:tRNA 2-thiocytidine(32) synthetase TtcA [Erysipelotrichaceae bacterium]
MSYNECMSMKKILAQVRKADQMYRMIENGDRIAVGLSGGKDSSLLLYTLYLYRFLARNTYQKDFELVGIHIDLNFGEENITPLL